MHLCRQDSQQPLLRVLKEDAAYIELLLLMVRSLGFSSPASPSFTSRPASQPSLSKRECTM